MFDQLSQNQNKILPNFFCRKYLFVLQLVLVRYQDINVY